jgi:phosphoglycerol transferase MdoB-like AlkP superfamily enzyme
MQAALVWKRFAESLSRSRYRLVATVIGLCLATSGLTRLAFVVMDASVMSNGAGVLLAALGVGLLFDLQAALALALPWVLYLWWLPERWFQSRAQRFLIPATFLTVILATLFIAVAESFFFEEFNGRFNFVAVDYLLFPTEVVGNIWESYHTGLWLGVIVLAAVAILAALRSSLRRAWLDAMPFGQRTRWALVYVTVLAGSTLVISPSLAHVSADRALNEVAASGYRTFWDALVGRDAPYAGWYARREEASVGQRLAALAAEPTSRPLAVPAVDGADSPPRWTYRRVTPPGPERALNVVVVLEESFGSEFVGALHPEIDSCTPSYDELSKEGTLLTRAYSTGNRTIRALEATTASLPPLPGVSIVRRELSKNLFTLPSLLADRGYQTLFLYGGRALFDGMGSYLQANGVERVVDQDDFPSDSFKTAWGVADEVIFDRALTEFDAMQATGQPFYSLILTVSNHRPYTFPAGRIESDPKFRRRGNAVRYADYALGRFMRQAREHAFFDHTLFVLMGDHGARVYGAQEIPLASYEVPILFYAPGIVPAGARLETLASNMDVPPTVLGILGTAYDSKFFGQDLFTVAASAGRALMTHNSNIALMRGTSVAVLGLHESTRVFHYDASAQQLRPVRVTDQADRELIEDAIAYYDGADRMYRRGAYLFESQALLASRPLPRRLLELRPGR